MDSMDEAGVSNTISSPGTATTGIVENDGSCIPLRKLGSFDIPAIITGSRIFSHAFYILRSKFLLACLCTTSACILVLDPDRKGKKERKNACPLGRGLGNQARYICCVICLFFIPVNTSR
jgi:hypothetical protein